MPKIGKMQTQVAAENVELCSEQLAAFQEMDQTDQNIFLTGKAGTGKTVLLRYFLEHTHNVPSCGLCTGCSLCLQSFLEIAT